MLHRPLSRLAVIAIASCAMSCSSADDNAAPIATPSVTLSTQAAAIGSPIDMRYRFALAPDAPAFSFQPGGIKEGETTLRTLILQGTPFERGRQHGLRLRAEIGAVSALRAQELRRLRDRPRSRRERLAGRESAARLKSLPRSKGLPPALKATRSTSCYALGLSSSARPRSQDVRRSPQAVRAAQSSRRTGTRRLRWQQDLALFLHFGPDGFEQAHRCFLRRAMLGRLQSSWPRARQQ